MAILTSVYNSTSWIKRGIAKASKREQKLYEKFLKNHILQNEINYKHYWKLFTFAKRKSKIFFAPNI